MSSSSGLRRYLLAMDDSGMQTVRLPADGQAFFIGGVVIPDLQLEPFRRAWLAETKDYELVESGKRLRTPGDIKAIDFLHKFRNETLDLSRQAAPALGAVAWFAEKFDILPLVLAVPKSEAGDGILGATKKGGTSIRLSETLPMLIGTFGAFLQRKSAYGTVRMDHLRNAAEETELNGLWETAVKGVRKVSKELDFVGSENYPEIQLADVLLGLLRGVYELDGKIPKVFGNLIRRAQADNLWFIQLS